MKYFLTTDRCGFSHWTENDLPLASSLWGDPEVTRYICASGVFSAEDIKNRLTTEIVNLKKYCVQYFPFFSLEDGELIGCCGLRPYKNEKNVYELGFHLRKEYWCKGYAFEAATAMINYAFRTLGAMELKAGHNPNNIASSKVLSKLGFQYECDEFYEPTGLNHPLYSLKSENKRVYKNMTLYEFEKEFRTTLGTNYKTKDVDNFNKRFIKENIDVSFLRPIIHEHEEYYRTYFQVTIAQLAAKEEKMAFIEDNFDLLHDWWHVDGIVSFLGDSLDFDYALSKAREYIKSELPYVRRLGFVLFIPRLVRDATKIEPLFELFKNDDEYHVVMGEAWLLSYLAMCDADRTYSYLQNCDLKYNIVGKAIQKICDSYVVSAEDKERFKSLRASRKEYK